MIKTLMLMLMLLGSPKAKPTTGWRSVKITTYSAFYHGRRTSNGETYSKYKVSVAVPLTSQNGRRRPVIPFGSVIRLEYRGRYVDARVNDVCPAGTYDLSSAAMAKLLGHYESTAFRGRMKMVRLPSKIPKRRNSGG